MKHKLRFKHYSVVGILLLALVTATFSSCKRSHQNTQKSVSMEEISKRYRSMVHSKFEKKAKRYNADTRYLLIVDYSIPSNNDRFFLWDTEADGIVEKFWCAHGFGGGSTDKKPVFSNQLGSNCSSLGWFLVEKSVGVSPKWHYRYHAVDGLDDCNSNARRRQLLIHPWPSVNRDKEAQIAEPMSLDGRSAGCFTMGEDEYATVDRYIKSRAKRMLLYAIDGVE